MTAGTGQRHRTCPLDRKEITGLIDVTTGRSIPLPSPSPMALPQDLDACVQELEREIDALDQRWCRSWASLVAGNYKDAQRRMESFANSRSALEEHKEEFRYEAFRALFSGRLSDVRIEEIMNGLDGRRRTALPDPSALTQAGDDDARAADMADVVSKYVRWLDSRSSVRRSRSRSVSRNVSTTAARHSVTPAQALACWTQHYGQAMGDDYSAETGHLFFPTA